MNQKEFEGAWSLKKNTSIKYEVGYSDMQINYMLVALQKKKETDREIKVFQIPPGRCITVCRAVGC